MISMCRNYTNVQKKPNVDIIGNIEDLSQFEDESIEEIYASHIIEHVDQKKIQNTFKGIFRILKKEGKFYVSVPDMDVLCHFFVSPLADKKIKFHTMRMIFGGQVDNYDYHYFGWNYEFMNDYLRDVGFLKINKVGILRTFCSRAKSWLLSTSILPTFSLWPYSEAISSTNGPTILHGPHHVAQ